MHQVIASAGALILTLLTHYGYHWIPGGHWHVFTTMGSILWLAAIYLIGSLIYDRRLSRPAALLILASMFIGAVENLQIAVCFSWYTWIYKGPIYRGDVCELMIGASYAKEFAFAFVAATFIFLLWVTPKITRWRDG